MKDKKMTAASPKPALNVVEVESNPLMEMEEDYQRYLDQLPAKKKERIINQNNRMQHGLYIVAPMICNGPQKCMIIDHCPIPEKENGKTDFGSISDYPVGQACVVERLFMQGRVAQLAQKLTVDPEDPIEMSIVNELAVIDLQKNRALMVLGKGDRDGQGRDFMRIDVTGYSDSGSPQEASKIHPVADFLEKLEKRRERWLDRLMETRKAKHELASRTGQRGDGEMLLELERIRNSIQLLQTETVQLDLAPKKRLMLDD